MTNPNDNRALAHLDPRQFLDEGHDLAEIFDEDRLLYLAEMTISRRLLDSPGQKIGRREAAADALRAPEMADPGFEAYHGPIRRWMAAIVADDALAVRVADALPPEYRDAEFDHVDRQRRPFELTTPGGPGDGSEWCGLCGEPIKDQPLSHLVAEWCHEMAREMERIKGILIAQAGAGATARARPTPEPPLGSFFGDGARA